MSNRFSRQFREHCMVSVNLEITFMQSVVLGVKHLCLVCEVFSVAVQRCCRVGKEDMIGRYFCRQHEINYSGLWRIK